MFINDPAVLHTVDEATYFCAAAFLQKQSTSEFWKIVRNMWSLVRLGLTYYIIIDQGSAFTPKEMKDSLEAFLVRLDEATIETPGTIGIVGIYHAPWRVKQQRIREELDKQTSDHDFLQLTVFAVSCTVDPEGLCLALLRFGAVERPARGTPAPCQMKRAFVIENAMKEIEKEQSRRRLEFGLTHKEGAKGLESSTALQNLPAGSQVSVHRQTSKSWEGTFKFIHIQGETVFVQLPHGGRMFRQSCVKPIVQPLDWKKECTVQAENTRKEEDEDKEVSTANVVHETIPECNCEDKDLSNHFKASGISEIIGLIDSSTFKIVDDGDIIKVKRIFGSQFVDTIKENECDKWYKSQIVAQNYQDENFTSMSTKAPTIQRFTQNIVLSLAASVESVSIHSRDITRAYI